MRLFLGIELSSKIKEEISAMLSPVQFSAKGWEHPHDYHMTLLFIGELPANQIPSVTARMVELKSRPFELVTTKFHFFSRRIMYLGFQYEPLVYALRKQILDVYPEFYRSEEKEFVPHITVKRFQRYEHAKLMEGLEKNPEHSLRIPVNGISLFKSEKDPDNRKYHVINRVEF